MSKFSLTPIDEVHLDHAPLAKVLMQVQYSRTPQLVTDAAEASIAESLGRYPVRRRQPSTAFPSIVVNGQPLPLPAPGLPGSMLQFTNPSATWQVAITDTAVSLETTEYSTRDDFCERSLEIFRAVAGVVLPPVVDRVGLRYIDRLSGELLPRVPQLVHPQLQALCESVEEPLRLRHSLTDSLIELSPTEQLRIRSGQLPAGAAFDPALPPLGEPSWLLDIDAFTTQGGFAFEASELAARLRRFAEISYAFFRFATTEAFQEEHQGDPAPATGDAR